MINFRGIVTKTNIDQKRQDLLNLFQKYNIAVILSLILILPLIPHVDAFSQSGATAIVKIQPGESFAYQWALNSDKDFPVVVTLRAEGEAADLLSFPESIELLPGEWNSFDIVVTIPEEHPNDVVIRGDVFALMKGEEDGSVTIFNVQMLKPFIITIGNPVIEEATAQEEPTSEMDEEKLQELQEENERLQKLLEEQQRAEEEAPQPIFKSLINY